MSFGVFAALHIHQAADQLFARGAFDFQIEIGRRGEVGRIRRRHVLAVNIKQEARRA